MAEDRKGAVTQGTSLLNLAEVRWWGIQDNFYLPNDDESMNHCDGSDDDADRV